MALKWVLGLCLGSEEQFYEMVFGFVFWIRRTTMNKHNLIVHSALKWILDLCFDSEEQFIYEMAGLK